MNLKKSMAVLLSIALVLSAGCQKDKGVVPKPKDELQGKIIIWTDKENNDIFHNSFLNYEKLHENVQIDVVEVNRNNLLNKLSDAVSNKKDMPDIICVEDESTQMLLKGYNDILEETSGAIKKDNYAEYKLKNLTFENKVYGIPLSTKPALMLYRTDIMTAAAVQVEGIKTWADYVEASQKVAKLSGKKMLYLTKNVEETYRLFVNQLGGNYTDSENKFNLNSSDKIKAAELMKKMYSGGIVQSNDVSKTLEDKIKEGTIASFIISPKELNSIYKKLSQLKENLRVRKLPAFEEGGSEAASLGGENLLILKDSKNKKTALDFCLFTAEDRENLKSLMVGVGIMPAYLGYYEEKWFGDNNWRLYSNLSKEINPFDYTEEYVKIKPQILDSLNRIIIKDEVVKSVLDELQLKNLSLPAN